MKRHFFRMLSTLICALLAGGTGTSLYSQSVVIQGGTLIDGNGGEPLRDALILIDGDRFRTVTTGGRAEIPSGAEVIRADGKYILPGWVDSHYHLADWHLELALAAGITTIIDISNVPEWTIAVKEGIAKGKIRGPRLFVSNAAVSGPDSERRNLDGTARRSPWWGTEFFASRSSEENLLTIRNWIEMGIDVVKFHPAPLEIVQVMAREARRQGIPTVCHCADLNVLYTVPAGVRKLEHATGVVPAIINDPAMWPKIQAARNGDEGNTWDWFFADPETYGQRIDEVIEFLIENDAYVEPTFESEWKGVYPEKSEFVAYDMQFLYDNPALFNYIPPASLFNFGDYSLDETPAEAQRLRKAYRNFQYFVRRFAEAGGKLHVVSDQTHDSVAGVVLHNEMILTQAAGVPPMQIIMGATRHPAEWLGKLEDLGTIEEGKLADLIVVTKDPLEDIRNIKGNVETVIIGGKVMDTSFHPDYRNPIPGVHNVLKYPNAAPELDPKIVPRVVVEGREAVTVTVHGSKFFKRLQAYFKGVAVPTRVQDSRTMEITIPAELLTEVGAWPITAINPLPNEGSSKPVYLWVKFR